MKPSNREQTGTDTPSGTVRSGRGEAWRRFLFLSLADERLSFRKNLCLAVEKGGVAAAVGRRFFSRIRIRSFKFYPYAAEDYPPPEFVASCHSLAGAELGAEGCPVILSLPKSWAVIRTVEYPPSVLENPFEVIRFDLDRITPFQPEEAYFDYRLIRDKGATVKIAVAAVRMETVEPYLKTLAEKGGTVERITVNLLGLSALARYALKTDPLLLLEIRPGQYEGIFYLPQSLLKTFSGPIETDDPLEVSELVARELEALPRNTDTPHRPKELLLLSHLSDTSLPAALDNRLRLPLRFLKGADLGIRDNDGAGAPKTIPYNAVGGLVEGLWPRSLGLNLLRQGRHVRTKTPWILSAFLALLLGFLTVIYALTPIEWEKKRLKEIENQIAVQKGELKKVEALRKEVEGVFQEISLIRAFKESRPLHLNILKELTFLLPKNTWLTRVRISESQVQIEGYSSSATHLIPRLDSSRYFKKVEFSAPTFRDPRQNMDRFQIKMDLEGSDHEKK